MPLKDMLSTMGQEETAPSWLVQKELLWLCKVDDEEGLDVVVLDDNIPKPFPKHLFEPHGWHDILATLDVCANVYATKHCDEEGIFIDIMSCDMVSIVMNDKKGTSVWIKGIQIGKGPRVEG